MKRSPLPRRKKPIARRTPLRRKAPLRTWDDVLAATKDVTTAKLYVGVDFAYDVKDVTFVSTSRATGAAIEKTGDARSPALVAFWHTQPCAFDCGRPAIDPHHYPPVGRAGVTVDALSLPACRDCHHLCHASVEHGGYSRDDQAVAFHRAWVRFWTRAPRATKAAVLRELLDAFGG